MDKAAPARPVPKHGSMQCDRAGLRWSYFPRTIFAIFFLLPPIYMINTSLNTSAERSAAGNPWWVYAPTLSNYVDLIGVRDYQIFCRRWAQVATVPLDQMSRNARAPSVSGRL